jgi:hypothetical protein
MEFLKIPRFACWTGNRVQSGPHELTYFEDLFAPSLWRTLVAISPRIWFRSQFYDSRHRLDRAANPVKPPVRTPIGASHGFTAPFSRLANTSYACRVARLSSDSGGVWAVNSDARYFPVPLLAGRRQPSQMPRSSGGVARRLLRLAPFARKGHSSLTGQLCRKSEHRF